MRKLILFLDDDTDRYEFFSRQAAERKYPIEIYWVKDPTDFAAHLDMAKKTHPFDIICLDFDIDPDEKFVYDEDLKGMRSLAAFTGMDCARLLTAADLKHDPLVVIHSWNTPGAQRMLSHVGQHYRTTRQVFCTKFVDLIGLAISEERNHGNQLRLEQRNDAGEPDLIGDGSCCGTGSCEPEDPGSQGHP